MNLNKGGNELRETISIFLVVLLLVTASMPALAAAPGPKISLEQAVKIAKEAFPVPENLTEFESNFSSYANQPRWDLFWRPASGSPFNGDLNVTVDANNGDILSIYLWQDPQTPIAVLPKYSRAEALKLAQEFAATIQPLFSETRLVESLDDQYFWGGPVSEYSFQFERMVNGYPYPNNNIRVQVNANTFEIASYRFNWDRDIEFPVPGKLVNQEEAIDSFLTKGAPRLIYYRPNPENNKDRPLKLVYDLNRLADYWVDAATGEVKRATDYWYGPAGLGGNVKDEAARAYAELSPAEQAEVTELANLLTQDQAIAKVKDMFKIPAKMKLERAHLSKSWEYTLQRQWNFAWDLTEKDKGGEHISASVDASTGDLLQYYHYKWLAGGDKKPAVKYSRDQAEKIAAQFATKYQSQRFAKCQLEVVEPEPIVPLGAEEPRSYSFDWVRYENEIPFPQQGFRIEVSSETGLITSYNMAWADHEFPSPEGIMAPEDVNEIVFAASPLVLEYLPVPKAEPENYDEQITEVGLFYHIRSQDMRSRMVEAKTGAYLDSQANPLPDKDKAAFTDLVDHPAAEAVAILLNKNIVEGSPDGLYHPDEAITEPAYLAMLLRSTGYQPRGEMTDGPWYKQYEDQARRRGILTNEDTIDPAAAVTRERVAVWTIRSLEQDRIASLQGIWSVPAKDAGDVQFTGHIALYLGQNLDPDRQTDFRPAASLTRGQAALGMILYLSHERY